MDESQLILKGGLSPAEATTCSLASYLYENLRRANPDSIALVEVDSGRSLSFSQLVTQLQSVAVGLRDVGVLPGDVVAVVSYNSLEAHVVYLATILLGAVAAMVPNYLDPGETAVFLRMVDPRLLFTEEGEPLSTVEGALAQFPVPQCPKLVVNSSTQQTPLHLTYQQLLKSGVEFQPTERLYNPTNPIVIMFSSGTTGTSKAIVIPERQLINDIRSSHWFSVYSSVPSTIMNSLPSSWITTVYSLLISTSFGHRFLFFRSFPSEGLIIDSLSKYEVSILCLVPTSLMEMIDWHTKPRCNQLIVFFAGSPINKENIVRLKDDVFDGKATILQSYGLTECGLIASNTPHMNKLGSVGKVSPNGQLKVIDEGTRRLLGPNQVGEICFRSSYMMLGYHNQPDETEKCFDDVGFFITGDLGYYDEEGFLYFTGRKKDEIKWMTIQVNPAQIEELLLADSAVKAVVVVGLPHAVYGQLVTAAVILNPGYDLLDLNELENKVNDKLCSVKRIRGGIHVFSSFPHTITGKVLRKTIVEMIINRTQEDDRKT